MKQFHRARLMIGGGFLWYEFTCSQYELSRLQCANLTTVTGPWSNYDSNQNTNFLDRQQVGREFWTCLICKLKMCILLQISCPDSVLSSFRIEVDAASLRIRYIYDCCYFNPTMVESLQCKVLTTPANDPGGWQIERINKVNLYTHGLS
jgi:hypothetical protein